MNRRAGANSGCPGASQPRSRAAARFGLRERRRALAADASGGIAISRRRAQRPRLPGAHAAHTPRRCGPLDTCFVRAPVPDHRHAVSVAVAINIANVVGRYVFSAPIFWAEEVLVFILVWAVFLAAATIIYRGEHINMDLFYAEAPTPLKRIVNDAHRRCVPRLDLDRDRSVVQGGRSLRQNR